MSSLRIHRELPYLSLVPAQRVLQAQDGVPERVHTNGRPEHIEVRAVVCMCEHIINGVMHDTNVQLYVIMFNTALMCTIDLCYYCLNVNLLHL